MSQPFYFMLHDLINHQKYMYKYLGYRLSTVLDNIEEFYFSRFYEQRFIRRMNEEGIKYNPIEFDRILGLVNTIKDDIIFALFNKSTNYKGSSKGITISLNSNIKMDQTNDKHIKNIIMHEFGHILYNQPEFKRIRELNNQVFKSPSPIGLENDLDYKYFSDNNELRQRIIPLVKYKYDYGVNSNIAYYHNYDDIYDMYSKDKIIYWIDNIL